MRLQKIPHYTTQYRNNPVELLNLANRMRIGIVSNTASKVSPTMTANNAPSPYVVSADSQLASPAYNAFKAMNGVVPDSLGWQSNDGTIPGAWWKIDFGEVKILNGYKIAGFSSGNPYPTAWILEGSNNDSNWTSIDSKTGQTLSSGGLSNLYSVDSSSYRYYRFTFSAVSGGYTRAVIGEIELYGIDLIYNNYIGA